MRSQKFPCFSCSFFGFPGPCDLMCAVVSFFRKRDPIMMNSLIKYSVMELQKSIQHDIMEKLNEHTEAGAGVRAKVAFCRSRI